MENINIDNLKKALTGIGYDETKIVDELNKIERLIFYSIIDRIMVANKSEQDKIRQNPAEYMSEKYTSDQVDGFIKEESLLVVSSYLKGLLEKMEESKKQAFLATLAE